MTDTTSKSERDLSTLAATVSSTTSLLTQLITNIPLASSTSLNPPEPTPIPPSSVNALHLAHDAASLLKAHVTKLSLLIINTPFTPTAITTILREVSSGPLPALLTATQLCHPAAYTQAMNRELHYRISNILSEFQNLVAEIPRDGRVLSAGRRDGTDSGTGKRKGSLAATGVVWAACDAVMELKTLGIGGFLIKKVEEWRDTVKDALEELQEWAEEVSSDEDEEGEFEGANGRIHDHDIEGDGEGDGGLGGDDEEEDDAQAALDALFPSQRHIPASDPAGLRAKLDASLKRIKLILLLYRAVIKRRLKTLPPLPPTLPPPDSTSPPPKLETDVRVQTIDNLLTSLSQLPPSIDDLAHAFYTLDAGAVDAQMRECFEGKAVEAAEVAVLDWEGARDEFSVWVGRFGEGVVV